MNKKPMGINSGIAIGEQNKHLPISPAARLAILHELLNPPIYDENENLIGYGEPLISAEEARKLLNEPD